jgi:hypothetical protein
MKEASGGLIRDTMPTFSGKNEKCQDKSQSGSSVSRPRFEPGTSQIRDRSVTV